MNIHTYKVAKNRGNDRVWIEGNRLLDAGIERGAEYQQRVLPDHIVLDFAPTPDGGRIKRVAGSDKRPIIDINSAVITRFMAGAEHYTASFDNTGNAPVITIQRA